MGDAKKAVKKVGNIGEKIVKETTIDPLKKGHQLLTKEPLDAALKVTGKAIGKIAEGMGGDVPDAGPTQDQKDLMKRQSEEKADQESELAKRKALRKKGSKGRGSLLSGSALGVSETLG